MLLPMTWLRSDPWAIPRDPPTIVAVATDLPASVDGLVRKGLWQVDSPAMDFGGYSAMIELRGTGLRLFSDRGTMLTIPVPGAPPDQARTFDRPFATFWNVGQFSRRYRDIESATRDPETLDYWVGFENFNAIARYDVASNFIAARQPPEMRDWPVNSGIEAMARLPDGRFLVLPEHRGEGLLFAGDPTEETSAQGVRFTLPDPYYATDMAALPDGRVLILARGLRLGWLPFTSRLYLGDPAQIVAGKDWPLQRVAELDSILPSENYEALAVAGIEDGRVTLWVASDDNKATLQRTLVARLEWTLPDRDAP